MNDKAEKKYGIWVTFRGGVRGLELDFTFRFPGLKEFGMDPYARCVLEPEQRGYLATLAVRAISDIS